MDSVRESFAGYEEGDEFNDAASSVAGYDNFKVGMTIALTTVCENARLKPCKPKLMQAIALIPCSQ
jgi:hypothetical protein